MEVQILHKEQIMKLFVLAGGLGTRLRKIVSDVPKPMALVNGEPFLSYVLRYWRKQGVTSFVISVGYLSEIIEHQYGKHFEGCPIRYIHESSPLGTGGAFLKFLKETNPKSPFVMVNGDTFFEVELYNLKKNHDISGSILTVCAFHSTETDRYSSIFHDTDGRIIDFGRNHNDKTGQIICNGGVYMVSPMVYDYLKSYGDQKCSLENDLIKLLIAKSKGVYVKLFDSPFLDIGLPDDYKRAKEFLTKKKD
ncbi:sugar phosphate nucleotidyltransferase [Pseudomonadota bacterium]|nr:sugar phosphate nucleotidyltransferase [Pseudomonadota bacterium]